MIEERVQHSADAAGSPYETLLEKIESRRAVISVVGLGYVGLPLARVLADDAGFRVLGIDIDEERVAAVNAGRLCSEDGPQATATRQTQDRPALGQGNGRAPDRLSATTSYGVLDDADVAILCVPTPLGKTKDPDLSHVVAATGEVARRLRPGMLVVLESTTYPGTTEELILPQLEHSNGRSLHVGNDFFLAFSPERIDPGRTDWTVRNTPKVVGGVTAHCADLTRALYQSAIDEVVAVSSPKVAEMVKLLENTFRATNIALVNEFAIMCDRLDVEVWEVIEAAKTKPFGYMAFYPGPGLGGHCIPIDPKYLAWKLRTLNYNARFIQLAEEINFGMPAYVLGKIADTLNRDRKPVAASKVLILGVAYKPDVGDVRESPAVDLAHLLREKGAEVAYHDPFVPRLEVDGDYMESVALSREWLRWADCVVITTAHSAYDWSWVAENSNRIVDTRNATRAVAESQKHIVKL